MNRPLVPSETNDDGSRSAAEQVAVAAVSKAYVWAALVLPTLGLLEALRQSIDRSVTWVDVTQCAVGYIATILGITAGFHRFFTHRSFRAAPVVQWMLGVLGSMACQGSVLRWVAIHREHHRYSDTEGDPHSPWSAGEWRRSVGGFFRAHFGWLFDEWPVSVDIVRDWRQDALTQWIDRWFPVWVGLGLVIPAAIGWQVGGGRGAWQGFVWGGLVRIFLVHHMTWCINSVCHLWGTRPFHSRDQSRNNWFCVVMTLGEGWHNNHHAAPGSARQGLTAWQLDPTYWVIVLLEKLGLVWDVKRRTPER